VERGKKLGGGEQQTEEGNQEGGKEGRSRGEKRREDNRLKDSREKEGG